MRVERCKHIVGDAYADLLLHCFVLTSTVVCKRECFDVCGLFHEPLRRVQDWDMWIRIARRFSFVHVPAVLTEYTWEPFQRARASRGTIADLQSVVDRALQADPDLGPESATADPRPTGLCAGRGTPPVRTHARVAGLFPGQLSERASVRQESRLPGRGPHRSGAGASLLDASAS